MTESGYQISEYLKYGRKIQKLRRAYEVYEKFLRDPREYWKENPEGIYMRSLSVVEKCDVMLAAGTSAIVYPAVELPRITKRKPISAIRKQNLSHDENRE